MSIRAVYRGWVGVCFFWAVTIWSWWPGRSRIVGVAPRGPPESPRFDCLSERFPELPPSRLSPALPLCSARWSDRVTLTLLYVGVPLCTKGLHRLCVHDIKYWVPDGRLARDFRVGFRPTFGHSWPHNPSRSTGQKSARQILMWRQNIPAILPE